MASKILVLSSGGDAPGMNAAIRAVVRTGLHYDFDMYGSEMGYQGLIEKDIYPLMPASVANCIQRGGTILKSGRCEAFMDPAVRAKCIDYLKTQNIEHMIVLGGNGSFRGAALLEREGGPKVIGIPCTIDNDIPNTEYCIGFDTARNTALEAIDRIRDTALSFNRNFIVEVMGRDSGFLAVDVGIAGGAEIIDTPEFPISVDEIIRREKTKSRQKMMSIIVVAEANDAGRSMAMAKEIWDKAQIEYKVCILGHTQRGGSPTVKDRKMGALMGEKAIQCLRKGLTQKMTAVINDKLTVVDFPSPDAPARRFSDKALLDINAVICDM